MTVDPSAVTAAEPGGPAAPPIQTLGKYRLDRVLGSGGMGVVWAAFDPDLERAVAIKLLHSESTEPTLRSRLLREARAMARLKHPNVVTVYEVGTDHNRDYIAMELVEGDSLEHWLETRPARPEILEALVAAGRGLAAAHAAGLVHRDFKPHNVLRSQDGHVFVTDFGLARGQIEAEGEPPITGIIRRDSVLDSPLTQTGILIGTPAYMAPEQFAGRVPDPRSDQFAFCVTAWEALTGARPFRGTTLEELEAAATAAPRALSSDLPPRLQATLLRGLAADPEARWPDMPTLLRELVAEDRPAPKRRRSIVPLVAGVAVVAIVAGVALLQRAQSSSTAPGALANDGCMPAAQAFDRAWSPAKQAEFARRHAGVGFGLIPLLNEIRRQWLGAFTAACAAPRTAETRTKIACLLEVRDDVETSVASANAGSVYQLAPAVVMCDPDLENLDIELPDIDIPGFDVRPPKPPPTP